MSDSNNYTIDHTPVDIISAPEQKLQLFTDLDIPLTNEQIDTLDKQRIERRAEFEEPEFLSDLDKKEKEEKQQKLSDDGPKTQDSGIQDPSKRNFIKGLTATLAAIALDEPVNLISNLLGSPGGTVQAQDIETDTSLEALSNFNLTNVYFEGEGFSVIKEMQAQVIPRRDGRVAVIDLWDSDSNSEAFFVPSQEQIDNFLFKNQVEANAEQATNLRSYFKWCRNMTLTNFALGANTYSYNPDNLDMSSDRGNNPLIGYSFSLYKRIQNTQDSPLLSSEDRQLLDSIMNPNSTKETPNKTIPIIIPEESEIVRILEPELTLDLPEPMAKNISELEKRNLDYPAFIARTQSTLSKIYKAAQNSDSANVIADSLTDLANNKFTTRNVLEESLTSNLENFLNRVSQDPALETFFKQQGITNFGMNLRDSALQTEAEKALALAFQYLSFASIIQPIIDATYLNQSPDQPEIDPRGYSYFKIDSTTNEGRMIMFLSEIFLNQGREVDPNITDETDLEVYSARVAALKEVYFFCESYLKENAEESKNEWFPYFAPHDEYSLSDKILSALVTKLYKEQEYTNPIFERIHYFDPILNILNRYCVAPIKNLKLEEIFNSSDAASFEEGTLTFNVAPLSVRVGLLTRSLAISFFHEPLHASDQEDALQVILRGELSTHSIQIRELLNKVLTLSTFSSKEERDFALGVGDPGGFDFGLIQEELAFLSKTFNISEPKELIEKALSTRSEMAIGIYKGSASSEEILAICKVSQAYLAELQHRYQGTANITINFNRVDSPEAYGMVRESFVARTPTQMSFLNQEKLNNLKLRDKLGIVAQQICYLHLNKELDTFSNKDWDYLLYENTTVDEVIFALQKAAQKISRNDTSVSVKDTKVTDFDAFTFDTFASGLIPTFYRGENDEYSVIVDMTGRRDMKMALMREVYNLNTSSFEADALDSYFINFSQSIKIGLANDTQAIYKFLQDMRKEMHSNFDEYRTAGLNPFPDLAVSADTFEIMVNDYIDKLEAQFT